MNLNLSKLSDELRHGVTEVKKQLAIVLDEAGIELEAEQSESFKVSLSGRSAKIEYRKLNEFYRGLTLLKIFVNKKQANGVVEETAHFDSFGIMLDCSRNAVKSVETVKSFIRHMALMGYNELQLYTEDTYEVENEPYFGYQRGRYTIAEFQAIDAYAAGFGVEVVPCIQTLAHLNAALRLPEYQSVLDIDDILLIGEERTYTLIDRMFGSLKKAFKSDKIHIGMDEAHNVGRGKYYEKHGDTNKTELLLEHLNRVVELCKKHGYKPMMWSDMFFRLANDGKYYPDMENASSNIDIEAVKAKMPDVDLVYWDYYHTEKAHYDFMADKHLELTDATVFAGGAWEWSGFTPHNKFSIKCHTAAFASMIEKGVRRAFVTMWGDNGNEASPFSVLPTLAHAAQMAYGNEDPADLFFALTGIDFDKFMAVELPDVQDEYKAENVDNPSKYMLYSDPFMGMFDTLVREGDGKVYAKHIKALSAAEKAAGDYAYIFSTLKNLCEVLELKYELGVKTRNAYNSGDPRAVKVLAKGTYSHLIKKLEQFYKSFKTQWMIDNKPNGFEVQDARIGGLIRRIEHCSERLEDYAAGRIDAIPELTEKLLPLDPNHAALKGTINFNNYKKTASVSE